MVALLAKLFHRPQRVLWWCYKLNTHVRHRLTADMKQKGVRSTIRNLRICNARAVVPCKVFEDLEAIHEVSSAGTRNRATKYRHHHHISDSRCTRQIQDFKQPLYCIHPRSRCSNWTPSQWLEQMELRSTTLDLRHDLRMICE